MLLILLLPVNVVTVAHALDPVLTHAEPRVLGDVDVDVDVDVGVGIFVAAVTE